MVLRRPGNRPGRPGTLTDVTMVDVPKPPPEVRDRLSPSMLARSRSKSLEVQHQEALRKALEAEDMVRARREQIRHEVEREFLFHKPTLPASIDLIVDKRAGDDGVVGYYIGQNQWQIQRAIMFATAIAVEQNKRIIDLLTEQLAEARKRDNAS